jgi:hypothetical protein
VNVAPVTIGALAPTNGTLAPLTWRDPALPDACKRISPNPLLLAEEKRPVNFRGVYNGLLRPVSDG